MCAHIMKDLGKASVLIQLLHDGPSNSLAERWDATTRLTQHMSFKVLCKYFTLV